jgi:hypothetical protein
MGKDNAPPLSKTDPRLALSPARHPALNFPLKGQRDAGKVFAEGNNIEPFDGSLRLAGERPLRKASISPMP